MMVNKSSSKVSPSRGDRAGLMILEFLRVRERGLFPV